MSQLTSGEQGVGSHPCSASDRLCDLGQCASPRPWDSFTLYEMGNLGPFMALNHRSGKHQNYLQGFANGTPSFHLPRNSDSVGLELA